MHASVKGSNRAFGAGFCCFRRQHKHRKGLERDQVDYLYNKNDIDDSVRAVIRNAAELGYQVDQDVLVEDEVGLVEYFKSIWR